MQDKWRVNQCLMIVHILIAKPSSSTYINCQLLCFGNDNIRLGAVFVALRSKTTSNRGLCLHPEDRKRNPEQTKETYRRTAWKQPGIIVVNIFITNCENVRRPGLETADAAAAAIRWPKWRFEYGWPCVGQQLSQLPQRE